MKTLHVLGGGPWGSGSEVVLAIVRGQVNRGDEVWIASSNSEELRRFSELGARTRRLPFWFRMIHPFDVVQFLCLFVLCRVERFDQVVAHGSKGGFLGRLAARLGGVKHIIYYAHAFHFHQLREGILRRFYLALERTAARAGDLIVTVSEEHRQSAIRGGVEQPERILTIPNGVDLRRFRAIDKATARRILDFDESGRIIGSIGRLEPGRGYEYLLRAMLLVLARHPAARLAIAGTGPMEEELRQEAAILGLQDRVRFLGFRRDIVAVHSSFDVFVQPSLRERLSISLIEAMAVGNGIVACDTTGNREVIEHSVTGLLAPPANARALADAICLLLDDPDRARRLGEGARRSAETRFSMQRMVKENLAVYTRLLQPASWSATARPLPGGKAVSGRST